MQVRSWPFVRTRIPPDLHEKIKKSAARNRRSVNSEALLIFEQHYAENEKTEEAMLAGQTSSVSE